MISGLFDESMNLRKSIGESITLGHELQTTDTTLHMGGRKINPRPGVPLFFLGRVEMFGICIIYFIAIRRPVIGVFGGHRHAVGPPKGWGSMRFASLRDP